MPRGRVRSWTDQQLRDAVAEGRCYSDVLRALRLRVVSGNFKTIYHHIAAQRLDTSHFRPGEKRDAALARARATWTHGEETVFCEASTVTQHILRTYALRLMWPYACAWCGNVGTHRGVPLSLHLDHINGNNRDNRWENLRWLCPNCHSQTATYCGRSSRRFLHRPATA